MKFGRTGQYGLEASYGLTAFHDTLLARYSDNRRETGPRFPNLSGRSEVKTAFMPTRDFISACGIEQEGDIQRRVNHFTFALTVGRPLCVEKPRFAHFAPFCDTSVIHLRSA